MVAIINDSVAKGGRANLPGGSARIRFSVNPGLVDDQPQAVGRDNTGRAGGAVPPADEISTRFLHQGERMKMHPIGLRRAEARPFIGRFLPPPVKFYRASVNVESGLWIPFRDSDSYRDLGRVNRLTVCSHRKNHMIQKRI